MFKDNVRVGKDGRGYTLREFDSGACLLIEQPVNKKTGKPWQKSTNTTKYEPAFKGKAYRDWLYSGRAAK